MAKKDSQSKERFVSQSFDTSKGRLNGKGKAAANKLNQSIGKPSKRK